MVFTIWWIAIVSLARHWLFLALQSHHIAAKNNIELWLIVPSLNQPAVLLFSKKRFCMKAKDSPDLLREDTIPMEKKYTFRLG